MLESDAGDGHDLEVRSIVKRFGSVRALDDVRLDVRRGEFLTILGPSGSGKTTLLKVIAGFEAPDSGEVRLGGSDVTEASPARRNIGMVFQHYALFPHMTVAQNVAFPLEMRRVPATDTRRRVAEALALVELGDLGERLPSQLSGGQQQRVALARAVVFAPRLLLLDEPFGALDRKLRETMQLEVRRLQRRLGLTTLFITHDQEEALVMSDRIAVMNRGAIIQTDAPEVIYEHPADTFVADFLGESNLIEGRVVAADGPRATVAMASGARLEIVADEVLPTGRDVKLLIRPERLQPGGQGDHANRFTGEVLELAYLGVSYKARLRLEGGAEILARWPAGSLPSHPAVGGEIVVGCHAGDIRVVKGV